MQSLRKYVVVLVGVLAIVALAQDSYAATNPLPKQTLEFTVSQPETANLFLQEGGANYVYFSDGRSFRVPDGPSGSFVLSLRLPQAINVALTFNMQGPSKAGDSVAMDLMVNNQTLISGYQEPHNPSNAVVNRTWYIPSTMLHSGYNTIRFIVNATGGDALRFNSATVENFVSSTLPNALPPQADLQQAAMFAWAQFIALNWPAQCTGPNNSGCQRDQPDTAHDLGKTDVPVVWQTFRHKTEVYTYDRKTKTRHGPPNGCDPWGDRGCTGGYSVLPPKYIYTKAPEVPNCSGQPEVSVPAFVNLDETSQIGENEMFAGIVNPDESVTAEDHLIRFLAKTNKVAYDYVTHNGYYGKNRGPINTEKNNITNVVQARAAKNSHGGGWLTSRVRPKRFAFRWAQWRSRRAGGSWAARILSLPS